MPVAHDIASAARPHPNAGLTAQLGTLADDLGLGLNRNTILGIRARVGDAAAAEAVAA